MFCQGRLITGYEDGGFGPNEALAGEQLAAVSYCQAGEPEIDGVDFSGYVDAWRFSAFAQDAMGWAVSGGILSEYEGGFNKIGPADVFMRLANAK